MGYDSYDGEYDDEWGEPVGRSGQSNNRDDHGGYGNASDRRLWEEEEARKRKLEEEAKQKQAEEDARQAQLEAERRYNETTRSLGSYIPDNYLAPEYNDPNAVEDYQIWEDDHKAREAKRQSDERAHWGQSAQAQNGDRFVQDTRYDDDFYADKRKVAETAEHYKGRVPTGSMVVDGKLISEKDHQANLDAEREKAETQFPWMKPLGEAMGQIGQPAAQTGTQPTGNIAGLAMPLGMQQMQDSAPAPTVTPQGGTMATYNPLGGTKFNPNPYKTGARREIGGTGDVGYGGGSKYSPKY